MCAVIGVVLTHEDLTPTYFFLLLQGGSEEGYGYRAHLDMIVTKGKGFRAEKTKKKRGSYKGGVIDFASHSFKFPDNE